MLTTSPWLLSMVYISVIILQITIFFTCWTSVGSFHVLHLHLSFWLVGTRHAYTSVSMYLWISLYQPYARAPAKVVFKFEMIKSLSLAWIWTHDLRGTKLVSYQLCYPAWVMMTIFPFYSELIIISFGGIWTQVFPVQSRQHTNVLPCFGLKRGWGLIAKLWRGFPMAFRSLGGDATTGKGHLYIFLVFNSLSDLTFWSWDLMSISTNWTQPHAPINGQYRKSLYLFFSFLPISSETCIIKPLLG